MPMGPKKPRSTSPSPEEDAARCVSKHMASSPDDCLYAVQGALPHLTRPCLHRPCQRHDISRLPDLKSEAEPKKAFKACPIGFGLALGAMAG